MRVVVDVQAFQAGVAARDGAGWRRLRALLDAWRGEADVELLACDDRPLPPALVARWLGGLGVHGFAAAQAPQGRDLPAPMVRLASAARREALLADLAPDLLVECWRADVADAACAWEPDDGQGRQRIRLCWSPSADAATLAATSQSASPVLQGEVKRVNCSLETKIPLKGGGDAPTGRTVFFTLPASGPLPGLDTFRQALPPAAPASAAAPRPAAAPRLAYVSPLPPVPSGIADYSVDIVPALAEHFDVTLVLAQAELRAPALESLPRLGVAEFRRRASEFDHVLYHLGNSPHHAYIVELLREIPGVVVLHDVYLGHLLAYLQSSGRDPNALRRAVWQTHGLSALRLWRQQGVAAVLDRFPACGELLAWADGVIVHSHHARERIEAAMPAGVPAPVAVVPLPQAAPAALPDRAEARRRLGIAHDTFLTCSFGYAGPGKLARELVIGWRDAGLAADAQACLHLVGGHQLGGESARQLEAELDATPNALLTGYADAQTYRDYLAAADLAVQLRTASRGETSRAVLEVMAHGIPLIANAHGANAEVPAEWLTLLDDPLDPQALAQALRAARHDPAAAVERAAAGRNGVRRNHAPGVAAEGYRDAIARMAGAETPLARQRAWLRRLSAIGPAPTWAATHWFANELARLWPAGRLRPALAPWSQPARQAPARSTCAPGARLERVLLLDGGDAGAQPCGETRRREALREAYRRGGLQLVSLEATGAWPEDFPRSGWDLVHSDGSMPWRSLAGITDPHGRRALRVLALPRHLRPTDKTERRWRELIDGADLILADSSQQAAAWRLPRPGQPAWLVVPNGGDPTALDPARIDAVYRDHLPQRRFAAMVGDDDPATIEAFEHYVLGASLAYLPPNVRLIVAGRLGSALRERPRFQRWAGINLARGLLLVAPDDLTLAAVRRHAAVWLLPRLPAAADPAGSVAAAEALAEGVPILATSAALAGLADAVPPNGVWLEETPERFRQRLLALLQAPVIERRQPGASRPWWRQTSSLLPWCERLARGSLRPERDPI
ncbi:MAG: glycosyltransferase [Pigmentiphaga sp.]|nr:glycosyltransferase [Pigmentiphaga sp.]